MTTEESNNPPAGEDMEQPPEPKIVSINFEELDKIKQEAAECKDKYLRLLAESENMRKRLSKEKNDMMAFAKEQLIAEFLSPIDHMEKALGYTEQMSEDIKHWSLGFQMILTQFKDVLTNHGVRSFISVGTSFNPHLHEAVETEDTNEVPPGQVLEEFIKGYKMGEKTIRPARVKVSASPAKS